MKIRGTSLLAFVALLYWCGAAWASTLVVNCTTVSSPTELNANIVCAQFNIGGATLQSVEISVSGTITGAISLTNNASTSQTGEGTTSSSFNAGALAGFTFTNPLFPLPAFTTGPQTLSAGQTLTVSGLSGSGSGSLGTNSSMLGPYTGAGTFSIPISTVTGYTFLIGGGNFGTSQVTSAEATAVETFTFCVPSDPSGCGGDCPDKCGGGFTCTTGTDCQSGVCLPNRTCEAPPTPTPTSTPTATPTRLPNGANCTSPTQCQSPFCVDGVCCDTACNGPLEQCNLPGQVGTCASTAASAPTLTPWGLLVASMLLASVAAFALRYRMRSR